MISVVARDVMKQKQQAISDILKKWTKLRESTRLAESMVVAEKLASCATDVSYILCPYISSLPVIFFYYFPLQEFIVANVDFGADGKIAKKIQEKIKGINENLSIFLLSVDDAGEK